MRHSWVPCSREKECAKAPTFLENEKGRLLLPLPLCPLPPLPNTELMADLQCRLVPWEKGFVTVPLKSLTGASISVSRVTHSLIWLASQRQLLTGNPSSSYMYLATGSQVTKVTDIPQSEWPNGQELEVLVCDYAQEDIYCLLYWALASGKMQVALYSLHWRGGTRSLLLEKINCESWKDLCCLFVLLWISNSRTSCVSHLSAESSAFSTRSDLRNYFKAITNGLKNTVSLCLFWTYGFLFCLKWVFSSLKATPLPLVNPCSLGSGGAFL